MGVLGRPLRITRDQQIDESFLDSMKCHLDAVARRAWEIL
jgi:hypothetical protein